MRGLRKLLGRSASMINVYQSLWNFCGERAGQLAVSYAELGADVGAMDQRTARGHIERLAEVGLLDIIDRDRRTGVVTMYVYDHRELGMPRRLEGDPQTELFETGDAGETSEAETTSDAVDTVSMNASLPRQEVTEARGFARGGFCAETPARSEPPARIESNSLSDQRVAIRTSPPPPERRAVSDHGTIENKDKSLNHTTIEHYGSMVHGGAGVSATAGGAGSRSSQGDPPREDLVEFHRRRGLEELRDSARLPKPIEGVLVDAVNRLADREHPLELKKRLKNFIRRAVRDDQLAESIIGGFADNVLVDGLPEDVILAAIEQLNKTRVHTSRGGTFQTIMRRLLGERGIVQRGIRQRGGKQNLHSHPPGHGGPETPRAP